MERVGRRGKSPFEEPPHDPPLPIPPGLPVELCTFAEHAPNFVRRLTAGELPFAVHPNDVAASMTHLSDAFLEGCESPKLARASLPLDSFRSTRAADSSLEEDRRDLRDRFESVDPDNNGEVRRLLAVLLDPSLSASQRKKIQKRLKIARMMCAGTFDFKTAPNRHWTRLAKRVAAPDEPLPEGLVFPHPSNKKRRRYMVVR